MNELDDNFGDHAGSAGEGKDHEVGGDIVDNELGPHDSAAHDPSRGDDDLEDQWEMDDDEDDEGGTLIEPESDSDDTELQQDAPQPVPESAPSAPSAETCERTAHPTTIPNPSPSEPKLYIERLSMGCPGAPLPKIISKDSYQLYEEDLHGRADADNPWTPFNGKMDWEIACWAKLRGPGSTAVSELLSIDGVSISFHHCYVNSGILDTGHIRTLIQEFSRAQSADR